MHIYTYLYIYIYTMIMVIMVIWYIECQFPLSSYPVRTHNDTVPCLSMEHVLAVKDLRLTWEPGRGSESRRNDAKVWGEIGQKDGERWIRIKGTTNIIKYLQISTACLYFSNVSFLTSKANGSFLGGVQNTVMPSHQKDRQVSLQVSLQVYWKLRMQLFFHVRLK